MTRRNILDKCINLEDIKEDIYYIKGSKDYYITKTSDIYKYYGDNKYYKMSQRINKDNGYVYCPVKYNKDYNLATQRVHRIVALTFIHNDDKEYKTVVGHKNNIKHDNRIENLYWTTNQENTKKAIDDKLCIQNSGVDNEKSSPVLVKDLENNIVAVYGSMREACRNIENLSISYLNKTIRNLEEDYKTRNKNYKYFNLTKEEYLGFDEKLKNIKLIERVPMSKQCRIFKATNLITGEVVISDNQKQFAIEYNLKQANISHAIIKDYVYENWKFEVIENIDYINSSGYNKLIDSFDSLTIKHIETNEELEFSNPKKLKDYFGIIGHDIKQYIKRNNLIFGKWKIIKVNNAFI